MAVGFRGIFGFWIGGVSTSPAAPVPFDLWTRPGTITSTYTPTQTLANGWVPSGTVTTTYTRPESSVGPWTRPGTLPDTWTKE